MENSNIIRIGIRFTDEDLFHCVGCINLVRYLLDSESDDESFSTSHADLEYLSSLLSREYQMMYDVIEASEGSDNDI